MACPARNFAMLILPMRAKAAEPVSPRPMSGVREMAKVAVAMTKRQYHTLKA